MKLHPAFFVLTALFIGLCCVFNARTPYREPGLLMGQFDENRNRLQVADIGAPDELQHANYVQHVRSGKGFPVLGTPEDPDFLDTYQSHQPPLYYLLAAGWTMVTGSDATDPDDGFIVRLFSTLIGVTTLLGIYLGCRWGFGREDVALGATAIAALIPMSLALHSAVSNDPLLIAVSTWVLAVCGLGTTHGWTTKRLVILGILLGVAVLTKTTGVMLFIVAAWALVAALRRNDIKEPRKAAVIVLGLAFLVCGGWLIRNQMVYGNPLALNAFERAFVGTPQASGFIAASGYGGYWTDWVMWWTLRSFVGAFSQMDIFLFENFDSQLGNHLYNLIFVILGALMALSLWKRPEPTSIDDDVPVLPDRRPFLALCWVLTVLIILFHMRFNATYFQGQGRYVYPAIAGIAALVSLGLCNVMGKRSNWAWAVIATGLLVLDFIAVEVLASGFAARTL